VFDQYNPDNAAALERVIAAAYRQVLGNLHPRESQRETSLEARLLNGEITVRDFVNGLAKSDFYKIQLSSMSVGAQRGIELNFKHLAWPSSSEPSRSSGSHQASG
jgi:phycoerythrin-associated linker protein